MQLNLIIPIFPHFLTNTLADWLGYFFKAAFLIDNDFHD